MAGKATKRKDSNRAVLKIGESQRKDGTYSYRWTDSLGIRHSVYAKTLIELREKEIKIAKDLEDGIKTSCSNITLNELFELWFGLKQGLKQTTRSNYFSAYSSMIRDRIGSYKISDIKYSTIKKFYISVKAEKNLKDSSLITVQNVLSQMFSLAIKDNLIRTNPCVSALKDFDSFSSKKRSGLTKEEQNIFLSYLPTLSSAEDYKNIFLVFLGTGLRVGELTGLQWSDIDFQNNTIKVQHNLLYIRYDGEDTVKFHMQTLKTKASYRTIPMSEKVRTALLCEQSKNRNCKTSVNGFSDFVFVNKYCRPYSTQQLDLVIKRVVSAINAEQLNLDDSSPILLPSISCHTFRHTFATRLFESDVSAKAAQSLLGHSSISITMDVYTDVLPEVLSSDINKIDKYLFTPNSTPIDAQNT